MDLSIPAGATSELAAVLFQTAVLLAFAGLFWAVHRGTPKDYLRWWGLAWGLYTLRLGAILAFLLTESAGWLFWHQVLTGWTALAFLGAALSFGRPGWSLRPLAWVAAFPILWSFIAIYRLDRFLLAAVPAVAFLSAATLGAAAAYWFHHRRFGSPAARYLAVTLTVWALHHLDYPFLRARGAWTPWGYYLDVLLVGAAGVGILLLVLEEHRNGLKTLSALGARILQEPTDQAFMSALLNDLTRIPGVEGAGLQREAGSEMIWVAAAGTMADHPDGPWDRLGQGSRDEPPVPRQGRGQGTREPGVVRMGPGPEGESVLSIRVESPEGFRGRLVAVGKGRHGLASLDDDHLEAAGLQIGIALDKATLTARLVQRTNELERLAARTVGQLEAERARISRELHDETAQALAAVRMRLAVLGEELGPSAAPQLESAVEALKDAIASIRRVASHLRPAALDELGLAPALRALARDFGVSSTLDVEFHEEGELLRLPADHELTIYRCLQEGLSNVARHARASSVEVALSQSGDGISLRVSDDGRSEASGDSAHGFGSGLAGMQERATALGGRVDFDQLEAGSVLTVFIPMPAQS